MRTWRVRMGAPWSQRLLRAVGDGGVVDVGRDGGLDRVRAGHLDGAGELLAGRAEEVRQQRVGVARLEVVRGQEDLLARADAAAAGAELGAVAVLVDRDGVQVEVAARGRPV